MARQPIKLPPKPDFRFEIAAQKAGATRIAGVDEVGRGPLAGPVMAAAVVLDPANIPEGLNDSKKLSLKRRLALDEMIRATADWSLARPLSARLTTSTSCKPRIWRCGARWPDCAMRPITC